MTREWKPGDVALIEAGCHANRRVAIRTGVPSNMGWAYSNTHDGKSTQNWTADTYGTVSVVRPLVVIDPEDREQVERLMSAYFAVETVEIDEWASTPRALRMRSALLSLIADPKPEEPTGLGAVVEDVHGHRWIYAPSGLYLDHWQGIDDRRDWSNIDAVKVLSEGVTA